MKRVLFLVILVLTGTLVLATCSDGNDGSGSPRASDPAEAVEAYVAAYNAHDIDRVMRYFADHAVLIDGAERIEGTEAIRAEQLGGFPLHSPGGEAYSISNLAVTGNSATWDNRFEGIAHTCVGTGNEAIVEGGKIVMWTFASITCD